MADAPRPGDPITYRGEPAGHVVRVEGNLCWTQYIGRNCPEPFIWRFRNGAVNALHSWPGKALDLDQPDMFEEAISE